MSFEGCLPFAQTNKHPNAPHSAQHAWLSKQKTQTHHLLLQHIFSAHGLVHLPCTAHAFTAGADELPPIVAHPGKTCSSYSSPRASMCGRAIFYGSSFKNKCRCATAHSSSRENTCSSCSSYSSQVSYARMVLALAKVGCSVRGVQHLFCWKIRAHAD